MSFPGLIWSALAALPFRKAFFFATALLCLFPAPGHAYVTSGYAWPSNTVLTFQMGLGQAGRTLQDGNTSWDAAVTPALDEWNVRIQRLRMVGSTNTNPPVSSGDRVNSVVFSSTVFGQSFGRGTLAVTYYRMQGSSLIEADILFNTAQSFDSYRGRLQFGSNGYAIADIRRVFLHEVGHGIGLNHPDDRGQNVDAVMNSVVSDRAYLAQDDINGAQNIYGVAAPTPTPTPSPTPVPGRLVNLSTRVKAGTGDNVLIGGFIVSGSAPKKIMLRGIGPSLAAAGISGALADPTMELKNAAGATMLSNDDWAQGAQAAEISASGLAPTHPSESAIVATLAEGSYTVILRGANSGVGVALVEAYEMSNPETKLANVSTRAEVGTGDDAIIGGFIVQGAGARAVVVRAVGPSLSDYGVAGALADPTMELRDGAGNLVTSNDDWADHPQASQVSARGLSPARAREAAIYASLGAGNFTVIVRGYNGGRGVGLVEVFEVP